MRLSAALARPLTVLLAGNLQPRQLALTVALGVTLGTAPLPWGASLLCVAAARAFRLNQLGLQAVNYVAWPLQLALFIPFCRLGDRLLAGWQTRLPGAGPLQLLARLGPAPLKALCAWLLLAPLAAPVLYLLIRLLCSRNCVKQFFTLHQHHDNIHPSQ